MPGLVVVVQPSNSSVHDGAPRACALPPGALVRRQGGAALLGRSSSLLLGGGATTDPRAAGARAAGRGSAIARRSAAVRGAVPLVIMRRAACTRSCSSYDHSYYTPSTKRAVVARAQ